MQDFNLEYNWRLAELLVYLLSCCMRGRYGGEPWKSLRQHKT